MPPPTYVLITPARNEAQFIELTLKSVTSQTIKPLKWVIVSDGSTDGTDEIVNRYAADYPWIELVRKPERRDRNFAGKVHAFNTGYAIVTDLPYDAIGSLDADLSFEEDYFAYLLDNLAQDRTLGLVGTPFREISGKTYDYRFSNIENVSGACQLFRRECFEQIGGYVPIKEGGIDHVALITCRMRGWKTRTFTDKTTLHHREMGTGRHGLATAWFKNGIKDHTFGNHPLWEVPRVAYQMTRSPFVVAGLLLGCGYVWAAVRRRPRPISPEMLGFIRREQMQRLRKACRLTPVR